MSDTPGDNLDDSPNSAPQDSKGHANVSAAPVIVDEYGKPIRKTEYSDNDQKRTQKEILDRVKVGERWMIILTAVMAGMSIFQGVESCSNNASTSRQVDRIIVAAGRISTASEHFSSSASDINQGVSSAVGRLGDQYQASRDFATLTSRQFHKEQRPYVGLLANSLKFPQFYVHPDNPDMGQVIWEWHSTDYGKAPAYHYGFKESIKLGDGPLEPSHTTSAKQSRIPNSGVVLPGVDDYHTVISEAISREVFNKLIATDEGITVKIILTYKDSYGTPYRTGVCMTTLKTGAVLFCDGNFIE